MSDPRDERPHDVLAAEEFGMPAPDPLLHVLHVDPPRDVLAAEEFGVPAGDAGLRRGPVRLPDETYPAAEAHDVLAAEEFAMPAGPLGSSAGAVRRAGGAGRIAAVGGALVAAALVVWRRRR